jgi:erythromycin esterase-like protein
MPARTDRTVQDIRSAAVPVSHGTPPEQALTNLVGDARFVLIGEATHGTHEFYAARAAMTRQLIARHGFDAVAVEADWPDAYRVNRYVHGQGPDRDADQALRGFERFPAWMWRNRDVLEFVSWLREHNSSVPDERNGPGFYGLDPGSRHTAAR